MFIWTVKDIIDAVLLGLFLLCMLFLMVQTWWRGPQVQAPHRVRIALVRSYLH